MIATQDQAQRELILKELGRNLLVEAAAGTGKTTSMVGRMVALLGSGTCDNIRKLAAVTFTRKAAAELRSRFQVALEAATQKAKGEENARLAQALGSIEQCYIGTIHSFCARLLRERPVEAGVDLAFREIDEEEDFLLREEAWAEYVARAVAGVESGFAELDAVGLALGELKDSFLRFADYPDVQEWPAAQVSLPDLGPAVQALTEYMQSLDQLVGRFPEDEGNDTLIPVLRRVHRTFSHCDDPSDPAQLMDVLVEFERSPKLVLKVWRGGVGLGNDDAKAELARWEGFRDGVAAPLLSVWREYRYRPVLQVLLGARSVYDEMRRNRGVLNFQDLLMNAAALLRDRPHVRRYFARRYTHLLVDEFQDTDPIQAEMLLLLTAQNSDETDWRRCHPRLGSLFVVGDPKQSIYRFRRADIVTYNQVKGLICAKDDSSAGPVVSLTSNFRTKEDLIDWVNRVFAPDAASSGGEVRDRFPNEPCQESPSYVPLQPSRVELTDGQLSGLYCFTIPPDLKNQEQIIDYEADRVARTIRHALDSGMTVARCERDAQAGCDERLRPSDFLILTRTRQRLGLYARKLQEYGIPHQVSGGCALNDVEELGLLHLCLVAVTQPENPVALVAALRGELFGMSDRALYAYKRAGGRFCYQVPIPSGLPVEWQQSFTDAFNRLRRYRSWLAKLPPIAAFEKIVADSGLLALASCRPGGDVQAGSLAKALELLRSAQTDLGSMAELVERLGQLVHAEQPHDGISARSQEPPVVRVMNLHKAKGLEAPVVFLVEPYGESEHTVELHVDRSGESIQGFLAILDRSNPYKAVPVALPTTWEQLAAAERRFGKAEILRLRYVAATRAGSALIVTRSSKSTNPWACFEPYLPERELSDPGEQHAPVGAGIEVTVADAQKAQGETEERRRKMSAPTYATLAAKQLALGQERETAAGPALRDAAFGQGEHGTEWGSVIHALLDTAMRDPRANLEEAAAVALSENDLDPGLASAAAAVVNSITTSLLWQRALKAERCLTEVPFEVLVEHDSQLPATLRGAIDLVFKEPDGWVLVDFKTDRLPGGKVDALVNLYAPQVGLYAEAWSACTNEPVKEKLLFFTHQGTAVNLA